MELNWRVLEVFHIEGLPQLWSKCISPGMLWHIFSVMWPFFLSVYLKHLIIQLQERWQRYTLKHKLAPLRECCSSLSPYLGHFPSCQDRMTRMTNYNAYIQPVQWSISKDQTPKWGRDDILERTIPAPFPVAQGFFTVQDQHVWEHLRPAFQQWRASSQKTKKKAGRQNYYVNGNRCTLCSISALLLWEWFIIQISTFLSKEKNRTNVLNRSIMYILMSPSTAGEKKNCCPAIAKGFYLEWYHSFRFISHYIFLWLK